MTGSQTRHKHHMPPVQLAERAQPAQHAQPGSHAPGQHAQPAQHAPCEHANGISTRESAPDPGKYRFMALNKYWPLASQAQCGPRRRESTVDADLMMRDVRIERGSMDDYNCLARFHYKSGRPSPAKAVFRVVHAAPTVVGQYLQRREATRVIGALVRSLPHLSCQMRDVATRGRYQGLNRRDAAVTLNREVRTISRVVIDPQWRGLGLAVILVRHALQHPQDTENDQAIPLFTEALAAMGRVSPFFERAGMTRYDRPPRPEHARLMDALGHLGIQPYLLAAPRLLKQRITGAADEAFLHRELMRWRKARVRDRDELGSPPTLDSVLEDARDELLAQPVYYAFQHANEFHPVAIMSQATPGQSAKHDDSSLHTLRCSPDEHSHASLSNFPEARP